MYDRIVNYIAVESEDDSQIMKPGFLRETLVHRERPKTKIINRHVLSDIFEFIKYCPSAAEIAEHESVREKELEQNGTWFAHPKSNATLEDWECWIQKRYNLPALYRAMELCETCIVILLLTFTLGPVSLLIDYFFTTTLSWFGFVLFGCILLACALLVLCICTYIPHGYNHFYYVSVMHIRGWKRIFQRSSMEDGENYISEFVGFNQV